LRRRGGSSRCEPVEQLLEVEVGPGRDHLTGTGACEFLGGAEHAVGTDDDDGSVSRSIAEIEEPDECAVRVVCRQYDGIEAGGR
jgi:hypothetical protein